MLQIPVVVEEVVCLELRRLLAGAEGRGWHCLPPIQAVVVGEESHLRCSPFLATGADKGGHLFRSRQEGAAGGGLPLHYPVQAEVGAAE